MKFTMHIVTLYDTSSTTGSAAVPSKKLILQELTVANHKMTCSTTQKQYFLTHTKLTMHVVTVYTSSIAHWLSCYVVKKGSSCKNV